MSSCNTNDPNRILIAVASSFESTAKALVQSYNDSQPEPYKIEIISGASGLLASQIIQGAPFDLFLSADLDKPNAVYKELNLHLRPQLFAQGKLTLWIPSGNNEITCLDQLKNLSSVTLANPETAPYGQLARQLIKEIQLKSTQLVIAANVRQAYIYVKEKFVMAGFVAQSQLEMSDKHLGCLQTFDSNLLSHYALLLNPRANSFYNFLFTETAIDIINKNGYTTGEL